MAAAGRWGPEATSGPIEPVIWVQSVPLAATAEATQQATRRELFFFLSFFFLWDLNEHEEPAPERRDRIMFERQLSGITTARNRSDWVLALVLPQFPHESFCTSVLFTAVGDPILLDSRTPLALVGK